VPTKCVDGVVLQPGPPFGSSRRGRQVTLRPEESPTRTVPTPRAASEHFDRNRIKVPPDATRSTPIGANPMPRRQNEYFAPYFETPTSKRQDRRHNTRRPQVRQVPLPGRQDRPVRGTDKSLATTRPTTRQDPRDDKNGTDQNEPDAPRHRTKSGFPERQDLPPLSENAFVEPRTHIRRTPRTTPNPGTPRPSRPLNV
jgi:hypothetical protein